MRLSTLALLTLAATGCGGSEEASEAPSQAPAASAPAPAPRPPAFPPADQFRLGEPVALSGGAAAECAKLYRQDQVIAIVETYAHAGTGAVVRRCLGSGWSDPVAPTQEELAAVGTRLEGRLAPGYEGLDVGPDGAIGFAALDLGDRLSELTFAGRSAAYVTLGAARADEAQDADVVGVVYNVPGRFVLQQFLLGTCRIGAAGPGGLTLPDPTWSSDGRAVTFHGVADRCSFQETEVHPE